jgi:hypothetical protein
VSHGPQGDARRQKLVKLPCESPGLLRNSAGIPLVIYHLVMTNIAMENCPFIDYFPIKTSIYKGFSMAMLNNQRVIDMMVWSICP